MKNITLSADERLIELARNKAKARHHSLNDEFRSWLRSFVSDPGGEDEYAALLAGLSHIQSGGPFTREQANER